MSDDLRNRVARAIQAVEIPESGWPEDRAGVWLMALDEAVKAADAAMRQWKGCGKMDDLTKRLRDWQTVYPCDEDKPEGHLYVEGGE